MSDHIRTHARDPRTGAVLVRLPDDRATMTGTPAQVGDMLAAAQRTGRLVAHSAPVPTGVPGEVLVNVRILPAQRVAVRPLVPARRPVPRWAWWAGGAVALAVLGALGWAVYAAVSVVAAHGRQVAGVLVALVLVALAGLLVRGRSCTTTVTVKHHR